MADGLHLGVKLECTDCPLCDAPGCFRRALIRALELGSPNYLPTNWRGFAEHFGIGVPASSPEELVDIWADKHPNRRQHTIRKVFEYAVKKQHKFLLEEFDKLMTGKSATFSLSTYTPPPQAPPPNNWERGLVTLAKIPVCAVSAVFIWSRGIMFVHYQLLNS